MGLSTQTVRAASSAAAFYLKSAIRLRFEPLLPESDNEKAAQADWANAGEGLPPAEACIEIDVALRSIKVLLTRNLSEEMRRKLECDRETLELRGCEYAHMGITDRISGMFLDDRVDDSVVMKTIDQAKADAYRRFSRKGVSPDLQLELIGHMGALNHLELNARAW